MRFYIDPIFFMEKVFDDKTFGLFNFIANKIRNFQLSGKVCSEALLVFKKR